MSNISIINKAVKVFKNGGVVIFPTDTVWGIGVSIDQLDAIQRLYQIKKRRKSKPTAVLVGSFSQAKALGKINKTARNLIKKYWPGGLTIVVKAKKGVPKIIQGKKGTVGLRMPNDKLILKILQKLGKGIVASSANFAGQTIPATRKEINSYLIKTADLLIEGESKGDLASTVVDFSKKPFKVLREGIIASGKLPLDK